MRKFFTAVAIVLGAASVALFTGLIYAYNQSPATMTTDPVTYSTQHHPGSLFFAAVALLPLVVIGTVVAVIAAVTN